MPLIQSLRQQFNLIRITRPVGIVLLLWPCLWGIVLAHPPLPQALHLPLIFTIGAVAMRSLGCIINDFLDQDLDAQVARCKERPFAAMSLHLKQILPMALGLAVIGLWVLFQLPKSAIILGLIITPLIALYPLCKRLVPVPQIFLGLIYASGVGFAYLSLPDQPMAPFVWLYIAAVLWVVGFDTIYAIQDIADDKRLGIKSAAVFFGAYVRPAVAVLYAASLICLWLAMPTVTPPRALALGAASLHYGWQIWAIDLANPAQNMPVFKSNQFFGLITLGCLL